MAINSKSKLRDIIADPRAVAILKENVPGFDIDDPALGPVMGMRIGILLNSPQTGLSPESLKETLAKFDALDA